MINNFFTIDKINSKSLEQLTFDYKGSQEEPAKKIYSSSSHELKILLKMIEFANMNKVKFKHICHEAEIPALIKNSRPYRIDYIFYIGKNQEPLFVEISPEETHNDKDKLLGDKTKFQYLKKKQENFIIFKYKSEDFNELISHLTPDNIKKALELIEENHIPIYIGWNGASITVKPRKNFMR